jgi:hypothetical protein
MNESILMNNTIESRTCGIFSEVNLVATCSCKCNKPESARRERKERR